MKYLAWLLKAAIFFTLFAFALNNQEAVQVRLFFGAAWQAPLVLVLLCAVALGIVLGMLVMLPPWLRARRGAKPAMPSSAESPSVTPPDPNLHGI